MGSWPCPAAPSLCVSVGSVVQQQGVYDGWVESRSGLPAPSACRVTGFSTQLNSQPDLVHPKDTYPQPGHVYLLKQNYQVLAPCAMKAGSNQKPKAVGTGM